ncbi:LysR family transcriptional regulator [Pseudomonas laurylsulfatiphila]|jgi:DNA-binding transcriptional LysR family regulator
MYFDEKTLLDADIHSLITFLVVHREGGVSRAAACLGVKQPAVSNTLARLRERFNDELFYRRGIWCATEKADQLVEVLVPGFRRLQDVLKEMEKSL